MEIEMEGFISLHRKLLDWRWYSDANVTRVFIHLLLKANFKDNDFMDICVKRGQLITSINTLSSELKLSKKRIELSLKKLEKTKEIIKKGGNKYTTLTIVNYNSYQTPICNEGKQRGSKGETKEKQKRNKGEQLNNDNNDNKEISAEKRNNFALRFDLFLSKIDPDCLDMSLKVRDAIRHFTKFKWTEQQMDDTANKINKYFWEMETGIFDDALSETINRNLKIIYFEEYQQLKYDYNLNQHRENVANRYYTPPLKRIGE